MTPPITRAELSSFLQFAAKALVLLAAIVLAVRHELTPEASAVIGASLVSLGVTNGATLLGAAQRLGVALAPGTTTIVTIPPPPPLPVVKAAAAVVLLALAGAHLVACAPDPMSPADHVDTTTELGEQSACVETHKGDVGATDACRAAVRARWDGYWRAQLDAGKDGAP
jgi:hypothetical protein